MTDGSIDISVGLHDAMPMWPGSPGFKLIQTMDLEAGDIANASRLETDIHAGTHVDAPWHFLRGGSTVDRIDLARLIGPAVVLDMQGEPSITAAMLDRSSLPSNTKRILFKTTNSDLWRQNVLEFQPDFVALTADAAEWVAAAGIEVVGVDYLSVQRFHDGPRTHEVLLGADVIVVEGLDLSAVAPGTYEFICLPLKILGAEGAPARAVLRPLSVRSGAD